MIVKGIILLVLSVIIANAKHGGNYGDLSATMGYGWHCFSGQHTGTKLPDDLVTERAPCLKITHPSDGYAIISPLEDHYQFEIDVLARGVDDDKRPLPSVLIEWFRVPATAGRSEDTQMQRLNDCRNDQVCNVMIRRTDPHQKLFHFRVAVSYVGHDETSSEDIVLEEIRSDNDLDVTSAPKAITNTAATAAAQRNILPTPVSVHQTHQKPFSGEVDRDDFVEPINSARKRLHSAKDIAHKDHRNPFLRRPFWKSRTVPIIDDLPFDLDNVLNAIAADQLIQDDDDVGVSDRRDPSRQSAYNEYLQPVQLVDRRPKLEDYITDEESTVFEVPVFNDQSKAYAETNKDETSRDVKQRLNASSGNEVNNETADQAMASKAQPQTKVDHYVQESLLPGLDNIRTNISKILDILSRAQHREQSEVNETTIDQDTKSTVTHFPHILVSRHDAYNTTGEETGKNVTSLAKLANMAHGLLEKSSKHLSKSFDDFEKQSTSKRNHIKKMLTAVDNLKVPKEKVKRSNSSDTTQFGHGENSARRRPIRSIVGFPSEAVSAEDNTPGTSKGNVRMASENQRHPNSFLPKEKVEKEFLSIWDEFGLDDENQMESRMKNHGRNRTRSMSSETSEESYAIEISEDPNVQTEIMTILTPAPGILLRKDISIVHETTQSPDIASTDNRSILWTDEEDQEMPLLNAVKTDIMTIVTPEPGVALRKDVIMVQPITQDLSITQTEGDQPNVVKTDIMTIVTPEPGVALRKDVIIVQPTTQELSITETEEDQLNAVNTVIMTIVTPEPGVALRKDIRVVHLTTQDLSITQTEEDQLSAVETDILTIVTPEPGVVEPTTRNLDIDLPGILISDTYGDYEELSPDDTMPVDHGVKTEIMTIITPEDGVALRKDLLLLQATTAADEDLQPSPNSEAVTEYEQLDIPTIRADRGDGQWHNSEQQEPIEFYRFPFVNDIADQYHKPPSSIQELDYGGPVAPVRPTGYQSQYGPTQDIKSPNQHTQGYETGIEFDDTDILGQGDLPLETNTKEMNYHNKEDNRASVRLDESRLFPPTSNEHSVIDTAFDYDLSGPFMKTPLYTTSQTVNMVDEVDETPLVLTASNAPFGYEAMDEVFDQISTSPDSKISPTSELINRSSEFGSEWLDFYKNPFPTKSWSTAATAKSESRAELHILVDESDTGPSNSSFTGNVQQKDHKTVNVSITGNIKAANVDFLSQILDLLRYSKDTGNTEGGKPLLTVDTNGSHLTLVQHRNSGISVGDSTIEVDGVRFNVTSVEQGSTEGKHQHNPPDGASDISVHIDNNDGYQVNIHRQKGASGQPTKHFKNYSFRNDNGRIFETQDENEIIPSDNIDDINDVNVQFQGNGDDDVTEKSMAPNHVESLKGRPVPTYDSEHRPADEPRPSRFMRQILPAAYRRRRRQNPDNGVQQLPTYPIIVSSVWSRWGGWGPCSVSCGRGAVTRYRSCLLAPSKEPCVGRSNALDECVEDACLEEEKQKEVVQDEGHSTEVECRYDRTQTPKEIYWMSPTGEKITKDSTAFSKKFKMTGDILIVRGVQAADAGTYHCVVIMEDDSSETSDAKIGVITCASQPCKNGGICEEHVAYNHGLIFKCSCATGFEGHTCEQVSPVFLGEMSGGAFLLIIIVVILLSVFVFGKNREKLKKHRTKSKSDDSPREVVQMEAVPSDKPLLTEGEIDLFREISREEFKNFKASSTYSMFKGKRESRADATLDIETVEEPTEDPITEVDKEAEASSHKKVSVIGLKKSRSGIEKQESTDQTVSKRKSSFKHMKTPVKKMSSGDSISLHPSPSPDIEKVEQQRSTHFALSSQGQSSIEDVLSLASYQESKPRFGSGTRLTPRHDTSLDEVKPRSGGSVSSISASSKTSTPKAKRSLFDDDESVFRSSRHDYEGMRKSQPRLSVGSTVSVPYEKPSTPSVQSSFRQATTTQISAHSNVQHQLPLKTSSKYVASVEKSSIISTSGHQIYNEAHRIPSVYGTDQTTHYSMEHTQPSPKTLSMHSTSRVETVNSSAKVRQVDEVPRLPSTYEALQRKSTSKLSTDSSGHRYQPNLSQHTSKESHSIVGNGTASSSRIYTAPLIVKSSSGNLRAVMPDNYSHASRRTSTESPTTADSTSVIHGSESRGIRMEAVSPQISRVFSKGSTGITKHEEVREMKSESQEWVPVTCSATSASPLGKQASALSGLQSATASLGSIRKSTSKLSTDSSGHRSQSNLSQHTSKESQSNVGGGGTASSSRIYTAPLIVKSTSGNLRAVMQDNYSHSSRRTSTESPTTVDSTSVIHGSESRGIRMEAVSPQISRVFSKRSTGVVNHEEVREMKSESQEWVPVTYSTTSASPLGKQASALSDLQSATASLGSIRKSETAQDIQSQKSPSKMSASSVRVGSISSVSSGKYRETPGSEFVHSDERISHIHSGAPLIVKSSSGHLRAVVPEEHINESRTILPGSPRKMSSHVSSIISRAGWDDSASPRQTSPVPVSGPESYSSQVFRAPQIVKSSSGNLRAVLPEGVDQDSEPYRPGFPSRRVSSRFADDEPRMSVSAGEAADGIKPSLHITSKEVMASKVSSMGSSPSRESRKISQSVLLTRSQSPAGLHGTPCATSPRQTSSNMSNPVLAGHNDASAYKMQRVWSEQASSLASPTELQPAQLIYQEKLLVPSSYHTAIGDLSETHSGNLSETSRFSLDVDASADATFHLEDDANADVSMPLDNQWNPLPEYDTIPAETRIKSSALLVDKSSSKHSERQIDEVASSPSFTSTTDVMASLSQDYLSDWRPLEFVSAEEGLIDDHTPIVNNANDQYDGPEVREETDEWQRVPEVDTINEAEESGSLEEIPSQKRRSSKFGYSGYVGRFSHILDTASEILDTLSTPSKMDEVDEYVPMESPEQTPGHVSEKAGPPTDRDSGDVSESFVSPQESLGHIFPASSQETLEDEEADLPFDDAREGNTDQEN